MQRSHNESQYFLSIVFKYVREYKNSLIIKIYNVHVGDRRCRLLLYWYHDFIMRVFLNKCGGLCLYFTKNSISYINEAKNNVIYMEISLLYILYIS